MTVTFQTDVIETAQCRYGVMSFFTNDTTVSRSLKEYGEWAQAEIEFLRALIDRGAVVVDVGAFIGTHTLAFADKAGADGKVYAYEPQPAFFALLKKNVEQNGRANVALIHAGVSDHPGEILLGEADGAASGNFGGTRLEIRPTASGAGHGQRIRIGTIDQLGLANCDLLKIDAENMELEVLRGALQTIRQTRPVIFAESNSIESAAPVLEFAKQEGYLVYGFNVQAYNPENFRSSGTNIFGDSREAALVLIPVERLAFIQERVAQIKLDPPLIPIANADDLALALLKKPQYKYEVMAEGRAASVLGVDFWATESQLQQLRSEAEQRTKEVAGLQAQQRELTGQIAELQRQAAELQRENGDTKRSLARTMRDLDDVQRTHAQTLHDLQTKTAQLSQIYSSRGWRALSVYYRVRNKLAGSIGDAGAAGYRPRMLVEGIRLLRDMKLVEQSKLLDSQWYLQQNPDVASAGVDPVRHYVRRGHLEGRDPGPLFSTRKYLINNPDVVAAGLNPLVHYLRHGRAEGRLAFPVVDKPARSAAAAVLESSPKQRSKAPRSAGGNGWLKEGLKVAKGAAKAQTPLVLRPERIEASRVAPARPPAGRALLCVSHVTPYPPRAGNEAHLNRMLSWLGRQGFEVVPLLCPLAGEALSEQRLREAAEAYPNLIVCERDGRLWHAAGSGDLVEGLRGVRPRDFSTLLGENKAATTSAQKLVGILRTFCPDVLMEVILHLDKVLQPEILLANYIFMTRPFPLLRADLLKHVDTNDLFSTKKKKVNTYGIDDSLALTEEEEASLAGRADLVSAVQPIETEKLRKMLPGKPVVTIGMDFDPVAPIPVPAEPVVLLIASDNPMNVMGLQDFLRFAWPMIRREVPGVQLRIGGAVGRKVEVEDPVIEVMDWIEDLPAAYAGARVVINPAVAGTGLKIKTVEALSHLRTIVLWPAGVDGLGPDARAFCRIVTNWYEFAQQVIDMCRKDEAAGALVQRHEDIRRMFSAATVYAELEAALNGLCTVAK